MQDLSTAHGSNIRLDECQQCNRSAFSGYKLDFECLAITVAVHHCPYIALFQAMLFDIVFKNDRI